MPTGEHYSLEMGHLRLDYKIKKLIDYYAKQRKNSPKWQSISLTLISIETQGSQWLSRLINNSGLKESFYLRLPSTRGYATVPNSRTLTTQSSTGLIRLLSLPTDNK